MMQGVHIKFVDDDDDMQLEQAHSDHPEPPHAPATHRYAPEDTSGATQLRCSFTIRTDYDSKNACYVFQLVHSPAAGLVAATLSNKLTKLYALKDAGLQFAGDLASHTGPITDVHFALPEEPALLHTCSADGTVRGWDVRSGQEVEQYKAPSAEVLCCHTNGALIAAGAGDKVLFWDRRTRKPAAAFVDTHAQDVTQVRFHPEQRHVLVSASDDGLVAVFDTSNGLDEDEGFLAALNIDTAPARLGFYGPGGSKLWCCSSTETLHLWEWAAACSDAADGGSGALGEAIHARAQLGAAGSGAAPLAEGINYLIGCEYNAAADALYVSAGTSAGAAGFFPVAEPQGGEPAGELAFSPPVAVLAGGHVEVVRSVLWPGAAGSLCVSGGEDARVCLWSTESGGSHADGSSTGSDGAVRRSAQGPARRASPY